MMVGEERGSSASLITLKVTIVQNKVDCCFNELNIAPPTDTK